MQFQNVVGETDQRPLAPDFSQAAQEEVANPAGFFDLAEARLHDRFPCRIDCPPRLGLKLALHAPTRVALRGNGPREHGWRYSSCFCLPVAIYRLRSGLPTDREPPDTPGSSPSNSHCRRGGRRGAVRSVARSPAPSVRFAVYRWPPASRSAPRLTATPAPLPPAHCSLAPDRRCPASGAIPGR